MEASVVGEELHQGFVRGAGRNSRRRGTTPPPGLIAELATEHSPVFCALLAAFSKTVVLAMCDRMVQIKNLHGHHIIKLA